MVRENTVIIDKNQTDDLVYYLNKRDNLLHTLKYLCNLSAKDYSEISFCGYRLSADDSNQQTFDYIRDTFVNYYQQQLDHLDDQLLELGIVVGE